MGSVCRATIIGHLGRDAEARYTPAGKMVLSFSVAADTGYGDNKATLWVRCSLWGTRGEKLQQYLQKGTQVYVEGALSLRTWTAQDGTVKTDVCVDVSELALLGSPKDGGRAGDGGGDAGGGGSGGLDEIPF